MPLTIVRVQKAKKKSIPSVMPVLRRKMPAQRNSIPKASLLWRFIKYWLPVITYAIFIFNLSSLPGQYTPKLFAHQDVVFHIIEYAIFAFLLNRAFKEYCPSLSFMKRFFWVFFLSILYAASDEFHQVFVPNRFSSLYDLAYDGMGIFITNIFYR